MRMNSAKVVCLEEKMREWLPRTNLARTEFACGRSVKPG